jgi:hypothetical protein
MNVPLASVSRRIGGDQCSGSEPATERNPPVGARETPKARGADRREEVTGNSRRTNPREEAQREEQEQEAPKRRRYRGVGGSGRPQFKGSYGAYG